MTANAIEQSEAFHAAGKNWAIIRWPLPQSKNWWLVTICPHDASYFPITELTKDEAAPPTYPAFRKANCVQCSDEHAVADMAYCRDVGYFCSDCTEGAAP